MKILAIIINKVLYRIGKLLKKGSSLPGQVALKIDKNILRELSLPDRIIMVTGSNGKTSTTEMICSVLKESGLSVGCNTEGANQLEGITTMVLNNSNLMGKVKKDVLVIEVDERSLKIITKYIRPKYLIVTNLYRDQLTRNGHPEFIYDEIKMALTPDIQLILNTDDPLSSLLGMNQSNVIYYGMAENGLSTKENLSCYDDGAYCPNCKHKLEYSFYHYNHIGSYKCANCGHERKKAQYEITDYNFKGGKLSINNKYEISLSLKSIYNAYNVLAAFAICKILGTKDDLVVNALNNYTIKNDRIQSFDINGHDTMLLTSKHENSISYDQSLMFVSRENVECTVVIIVDSISRKYFTSDTSWLWDIDFELLSSDNIKKVVIGGKYIHDLKTRMTYANISKDKLFCFENLDDLMHDVKTNSVGKIYVITCFSDRMKFLNRR